jgi:hypothetical protein
VAGTFEVWRIDTGISQGIGGGVAEVLEITSGGDVAVLCEDGTRISAVERTVCVRSDL